MAPPQVKQTSSGSEGKRVFPAKTRTEYAEPGLGSSKLFLNYDTRSLIWRAMLDRPKTIHLWRVIKDVPSGDGPAIDYGAATSARIDWLRTFPALLVCKESYSFTVNHFERLAERDFLDNPNYTFHPMNIVIPTFRPMRPSEDSPWWFTTFDAPCGVRNLALDFEIVDVNRLNSALAEFKNLETLSIVMASDLMKEEMMEGEIASGVHPVSGRAALADFHYDEKSWRYRYEKTYSVREQLRNMQGSVVKKRGIIVKVVMWTKASQQVKSSQEDRSSREDRSSQVVRSFPTTRKRARTPSLGDSDLKRQKIGGNDPRKMVLPLRPRKRE